LAIASSELAPPPTDFLTFDRVGDQAAGGPAAALVNELVETEDKHELSKMVARKWGQFRLGARATPSNQPLGR
jgi:hypothetical protein